jgi:hypothetical protein
VACEKGEINPTYLPGTVARMSAGGRWSYLAHINHFILYAPVRFKFLTAVLLKIQVFRDFMLCQVVSNYQSFG